MATELQDRLTVAQLTGRFGAIEGEQGLLAEAVALGQRALALGSDDVHHL